MNKEQNKKELSNNVSEQTEEQRLDKLLSEVGFNPPSEEIVNSKSSSKNTTVFNQDDWQQSNNCWHLEGCSNKGTYRMYMSHDYMKFGTEYASNQTYNKHIMLLCSHHFNDSEYDMQKKIAGSILNLETNQTRVFKKRC